MSTFATFLTDEPNRRRRRQGKVPMNQKFLRESSKYLPKAIKPKVNVNINPIVNYMTNQQNQKHDQKTMKYKSCTQIVPTVGLTNLIFYDCHKKRTPLSEATLDESIRSIPKPMTMPRRTTATDEQYNKSQFCVPEIVAETNRNSLETIDGFPSNFEDFVARPHTMTHRSLVQNFTLTSDFFSSGMTSSTSSFTDPNHRAYDHITSNISIQNSGAALSFELNLDDQTNQFSEQSEQLDDGVFEMNFTGSSMETSSPNAAEHCSQLISFDCEMKSNTSHSEDESMAKFAISSCSNGSLDVLNDFYSVFVPLHTSTPISQGKRRTRSDVNNELRAEESFLHEQGQHMDQAINNFTFSDVIIPLHTSTPISRSKSGTRNDLTNELSGLNGLLDMEGEESFSHRQGQINRPLIDFTFSDPLDDVFF